MWEKEPFVSMTSSVQFSSAKIQAMTPMPSQKPKTKINTKRNKNNNMNTTTTSTNEHPQVTVVEYSPGVYSAPVTMFDWHRSLVGSSPRTHCTAPVVRCSNDNDGDYDDDATFYTAVQDLDDFENEGDIEDDDVATDVKESPRFIVMREGDNVVHVPILNPCIFVHLMSDTSIVSDLTTDEDLNQYGFIYLDSDASVVSELTMDESLDSNAGVDSHVHVEMAADTIDNEDECECEYECEYDSDYYGYAEVEENAVSFVEKPAEVRFVNDGVTTFLVPVTIPSEIALWHGDHVDDASVVTLDRALVEPEEFLSDADADHVADQDLTEVEAAAEEDEIVAVAEMISSMKLSDGVEATSGGEKVVVVVRHEVKRCEKLESGRKKDTPRVRSRGHSHVITRSMAKRTRSGLLY